MAFEVELGDTIRGFRVTGWYLDGNGRMMIEYNNRWHQHSRSEKIVVPKAEEE